MIKLTQEKLARAIERARKLRPFVTFLDLDERLYVVCSATGLNEYQVRFSVQGKEKFADCNCQAGKNGMACYHVAAAAAVNIGIQRQRRAHAA
jgi:hypothetical protein